jgi:hypothetical protein
VKVRLEWFEISRAALVGVSRNVEALRKGCVNRMPINDEWSIHILGALGECAFAKASNRYWNGSVNTFKAGGDVGETIQVRTRRDHNWDLIVRNDDKSDDVYVLVTGGPQDFVVRGYVSGSDAKQDCFKADHGGHGEAFFVPQDKLRPIAELTDTKGQP